MEIIRDDDLEQKKRLFLLGLPKAELHVHLEGTLEPETILQFAQKNKLINFPFSSPSQITQRMADARDLLSFIQIYEQFLSVLVTEDDFCEAVMKYFSKIYLQGVIYVEMFFDPQMHTSRGISFDTIISGLRKAIVKGKKDFGIECKFIVCFNRDKPISSAMEHLNFLKFHKDIIIGIGLDNPEHKGFPKDFEEIFKIAKEEGFHLTSHCDADYQFSISNIFDCINLLQVERIDHGVNILDNEELMKLAKQQNISFTVCPTLMYTTTEGEYKTNYFMRCAIAAKEMKEERIKITIASDDPGIMCSRYIGDIYYDVSFQLSLSTDDMVTFARNGIEMAWITEERKKEFLEKLNLYVLSNKI